MFEPKLMVKKAERSERIATIVKYVQVCTVLYCTVLCTVPINVQENRGQHSFYFLQFLGCEILNFVNVVGQMFFMDR